MLAGISFRGKMLALGAFNLILIGLLMMAANVGMSALEQAVSDQTRAAGILRNEVEADMLHDAVNSDVLAVLLASLRPLDLAAQAKLTEDFKSHSQRFGNLVQDLSAASANPETQRQVAQVQRDVASYLASAEATIKQAFVNRSLAEQNLGSFESSFEVLEKSLEELADKLETEMKIGGEAAAASADRVLFWAGTLGLLLVLSGNILITRNLYRELGGDPRDVAAVARRISNGDLSGSVTVLPGDTHSLMYAMSQVKQTLEALSADTRDLVEAALRLDLDTRADATRHQGQFRAIVQGINDVLDGFILPLRELIADVSRLASNIQDGKLDVRADPDKHQGAFAELTRGVNAALDSVIRPLLVAAQYVEDISKGKLPPRITEPYRGDFNTIKSNLNQCIDALDSLIQEMDRMSAAHDAGETDVQIDSLRFQGSYQTVARGVNRMVAGHIADNAKAMACVKAFGEGQFDAPLERFPGRKAAINDTVESIRADLKALIDDVDMLSMAALEGRIQTRADASRHHGDFRKIVEGVNATLETIVSPILVVKDAADAINTAAREISSGNSDLSRRTEQQAASLEETASSMKELAATVTQNSDNARRASRMAVAASEVANKGGQVVHKVVGTMQEINESSRRIVDIISVIDGIAFQTNILALNAAVEAARAGEQGRGFAVVAGEVRNLAQRSAAAAKEIKVLIGNSVEKVDDGSRLVEEAGKTMQDIVQEVTRMTQIMSEIASASMEQTSGIERVNHAISQMDEVTQQNAALVEEAAAAAESMKDQAANLAETVMQFRLEQEGGVSKVLTQPRVGAPLPHRSGSSVDAGSRQASQATARPVRVAIGDAAEAHRWTEF